MKTKFNFQKIIFLLLISMFLISFVNTCVQASSVNSYHQQSLNLQVKSAIAIDSKSGQVLYAKNSDKVLPIASMTKLITVYLTLKAIQSKKIAWNTKVRPTATITKVANNSQYSNVPLKKNHLYTIKQLFQATLIESANGAAMSLAQAVAGSQTTFVKQMRQQLNKWNITDAKIYTTCGLPNANVGKDAYPGVSKKAENSMSASDMAIVGKELLNKYPDILATTEIPYLNFKDKNKITKMTNFNWMLKGLSQYDPSFKIDGLKTGTTDAAGACFIGTLKYKSARIITVVMGASHQDATDPSRFLQTKKLLNWVYTNYMPVTLKQGFIFNKTKNVAVVNGNNLRTAVALKNKTIIWDPIDSKQISAILVKKRVNAPIKKGQIINQYYFKSGNQKLISLDKDKLTVPVQSLANNGQVNFFIRIWRWITGVK